MRSKPALDEARLAACLHDRYALTIEALRYLPIGYDLNAWVYEASAPTGESYFVKVRSGAVPEARLLVPRMLLEYGIPYILAPLRTRDGALCCTLDSYSVTVTPYICGENAMNVGMTDRQWREFGATLNAIHSGGFAERLQGQVPTETFAILSADLVRRLSDQLAASPRFDSPAADTLAACWREQQTLIDHIVNRAEMLGRELQTRTFPLVLCHADIHAANILVGEDGVITLVDWDGPLLAPKERDLLFVVGSCIARRVTPREEALFFEGYGPVEIDWTALAYYRYERAIEDIGEFGRSVLHDPNQTEAVKADETRLFAGLFAPDDIIASAMEADRQQDRPTFPTPKSPP